MLIIRNVWTQLILVSRMRRKAFHAEHYLITHYLFLPEENSIGGTIPSELGKLNKLRYIMLEGAENRTNYLSNQFETLSGTIPTELGSMSQLVFLDLNFNKLSGTVSLKCIFTTDRLFVCCTKLSYLSVF